MRKRAAGFALVVVATTLVGATESRGQGSKPLDAEQQAAKAAFDEEMKSSIKKMKDDCGFDLVVTTDFENFNATAWLNAQERKNKRMHLSPADSCAAVVEKAAFSCRHSKDGSRDKRKGEPPPAATSATAKPAIKALNCLFAGFVPRKEGEGIDSFVLRNMSYANGVFTLRNSPQLVNIDSNVYEAMHPPDPNALPESGRRNGLACTQRSHCDSFACAKGVCAACGPKVRCAEGAHCEKGQCWSDAEPEQQETSSPSPSRGSPKPEKAAKQPLGGKCKWNDDCESKICGTISSGQKNKCVSKR